MPGGCLWQRHGRERLTVRFWLGSSEGGRVFLGKTCEVSWWAQQNSRGEKTGKPGQAHPPFWFSCFCPCAACSGSSVCLDDAETYKPDRCLDGNTPAQPGHADLIVR